MGRAERPLSPFMQYRWLYSNTLSVVHRFTGILLSAGFLILVFWLVAAASGPERYAQALSCLASLPMQLVLASVLWSYCYHFLNGIRHLFMDAGAILQPKAGNFTATLSLLLSIVLAIAIFVAAGLIPGLDPLGFQGAAS